MRALSAGSLALALLFTGGCRNLDEDVGESKRSRDTSKLGYVPPEYNEPTTAPGRQPEQQAKEHKLAANVENSSERTPTETRPSQANDTTGKRISADATFVAGPGVKLHGDAELREVPGGVRIEVEVEDAPAGPKGIHIHQKGDCSDIPGKSMGEHLTTTDEPHGLPSAAHHHTGDMGNIQVDASGDGELSFVVPAVHLEGSDARSLANRAIVIHEKEDTGQGPSGQSGKPIACAVIRPS